jgi:hypothetical protein
MKGYGLFSKRGNRFSRGYSPDLKGGKLNHHATEGANASFRREVRGRVKSPHGQQAIKFVDVSCIPKRRGSS